jgi:hypothetical protein
VRSRFNVRALTSTSAEAALRRISLSQDSPYLMPPRRASTLTAQARERIEVLLRRTRTPFVVPGPR